MTDWVLATEESGYTRHYDAAALPVSIGSVANDDIVLAEVAGSVQIGLLDGIFFVQPVRGTENVRLDGELLRGSRRLADGSVIALDTARLTCRLGDGRLTLAIDAQITTGDTAPPDFAALAADRSNEMTVSPIAFDPKTLGARSGSRRIGIGGLVIYSAFVVLAVLGWFAFTAKSVHFEMTPAAQLFELPDTLFQFEISSRYLLRSGDHHVVAELDGYYPIDETVGIGSSRYQTVALEFVRLPGLISFATEPETGAEVRLDDELIGTTPIEDYEVRPGTHQVRFTAERYLTELVSIEVAGGHERDAVITTLTPSWAPVSVTSKPAGADVLVDGNVLDRTPAELELTAGEREIELRLAGYNPWRRQVMVIADQPLVLPEATLSLADAYLSLTTVPSNAIVQLDGEFLGRTPVNLTLRPNVEHSVTVQKQGYADDALQFTLAPGARRSETLQLVEQRGTIKVVSTPAGADVVVDGETLGQTPLDIEMMAVEQTLVVFLPGYAPVGRAVTPRPGYPLTLAFDLVTLDLATGSGFPPVVETRFGPKLKVVPGATFQMGASRNEPDRSSREVPRAVQVTTAFYLAETEVTNGQYRAHCDPDHDSGSFGGYSLDGDDQPVVNVSVRDAKLCLNKLSILDGLQPYYDETDSLKPKPSRNGYRLPTEAEHVLAARVAGLGDAEPLLFSWGNELPPPADRIDNIADLSARDLLATTLVTYTDGYPVSAPVGSFLPNAVGLFDMGGNVSEWVQDFYDPVAQYGDEVLVDPHGPEDGRQNIVRGPNWQSATRRRLRLSYLDIEDSPRETIGFRVARDLE